MDNMIYLLSVTVAGIKCIEKPITVRFYKKVIGKDFNPEKYRVKAIYGENGTGKSALVTAMYIFKNLVVDEDYLSDISNQKLLKEIINKNTKCFHFECEFLSMVGAEKTVHRYCIELKMNEKEKYEISHEQLERKNGNYHQSRFKKVFECKEGKLISVDCDDDTKKCISSLSFNLLSMRSLEAIYLSHVEEFDLHNKSNSYIRSSFFCAMTAIFTKIYLEDEDRHELYFIQKKLSEEFSKEEWTAELFKYLNKCAVEYIGVNEKKIARDSFGVYKEKVSGLCRFIKLFKKELISIEIDSRENGDYYQCELVLNYGKYRIAREFESTGIKKLIRLYDCLVAAGEGGIVFIDEMDSNINDVYLCRLIEYFMYYGRGQLCFTTHNIDPMNVLQDNKNSIEFLSDDNILVPWTSKGNAKPESYYKNGMIANIPFNLDPTDFVGVLGG